MRKQTLLRIGLPPDTQIYPSRYRELLAREAGTSVPHAFFHADNKGNPLPGLPGVRVVGGKGWIGVLADEHHAPMLYDVMGYAVRAANSLTGRYTPVEIQEHTLDLEPLQYPQQYWVREMVLKRRSRQSRNADLVDLVRERLTRGVVRMAAMHGIDCPTDEQLQIDVTVQRNIGLQLLTTRGPTEEWPTLVDASFTIHATLKGMWFAGNLTSRGYGRIGRDLAQLSVHYAKEQQRQHQRRMVG